MPLELEELLLLDRVERVDAELPDVERSLLGLAARSRLLAPRAHLRRVVLPLDLVVAEAIPEETFPDFDPATPVMALPSCISAVSPGPGPVGRPRRLRGRRVLT